MKKVTNIDPENVKGIAQTIRTKEKGEVILKMDDQFLKLADVNILEGSLRHDGISFDMDSNNLRLNLKEKSTNVKLTNKNLFANIFEICLLQV
eukprot:snap_masked-scaffold_88-processed-gene-0.28-mRNA-1 protein AED:1.00 eAED:1.00 QI:0/0/0/0/1/1/2/0/92